jgi:hypothetical protein
MFNKLLHELKIINETLIDKSAIFIEVILSAVYFILYYLTPFIFIPWAVGLFYRGNYIEGFKILIIFIILFYVGLGLDRYFERGNKLISNDKQQ